ncbi:hypothetical protein G159_18685 [Planococcus glaciei CHR43]|uniref:hypothetical protein n=1 Tax=Planococcus glaciei TaxID=459472 RepID=UPI0003DF26F2|nr:hypothetical protein [Planococcus glaciei]ETP67172.1 hypothetical protein G159_18685 [Planococcus glaciei CHR43]
MKRLVILMVAAMTLAACQKEVPAANAEVDETEKQKLQAEEEGATVIDWVDFVQFEGKHYTAVDTAVLSEKNGFGRKVGEVGFKVADNINSTNYQVKNGDAAFWEKGTALYEVKKMPDFLAVKDEQEVNGYRLYLAEEAEEDFPHHFKDVELDRVKAVEFYTGEQNPELLNRITKRELEQFKELLAEDVVPKAQNANRPDPELYRMILYTDEPFAHAFYLYNENGQWLWYPWDEEFLPDAVEKFVQP